MPDTPARPAWFDAALAVPSRSHVFHDEGTPLFVKTWNWDAGPHTPAVLLTHGFLAHTSWWDAIAPSLLPQYRVAAFDFSGMGNSGPRATYSPERFARDVLAVIDHLQLAPATVVGHSYGGSRALLAASLRPESFERIVALDSVVCFPTDPRYGNDPSPRRVYPDLATAKSRYRLMPPQDAAVPEVLDHLATESLKPFEGGWTWKFDPALWIEEESDGLRFVERVRCPVHYVRAGNSSLIDEARAQRIHAALQRPASPGLITLPGAHHHLLVDQPQQTAALLRRLLAASPG